MENRGEGKCRGNHAAINRKQLNTLTSAMEGLQTHHHAPCELDIEGSLQLRDLFQPATTLSTSEGEKENLTAFRTGHIQLPQPQI